MTFHFEWHSILSEIPYWVTFHFEWHSILSDWLVSQSQWWELRWYRTNHFQSASESVTIIRTRDASASKKTQYYPWLPFVYLLKPLKQTYLVGWFLALFCFYLPFLHSLHLFHMLLHKSGSQQNRVYRITGTRYEENKVRLIPFKRPSTCKNYSLDWNGLHNLVMKSLMQKKAFSLEYLEQQGKQC